MILWTRSRLALALVGVALVSFSCGGGSSSPAGPSAGAPSDSGSAGTANDGAPTPTPSPSPGASPAPTPSGLAACALGYGDYFASCTDKRLNPQLLADVDAAINQLVEEQPELFDRSNVIGENGYFVLDTTRYYDGVIGNLRAAGFCADAFDGWLDVKNTNDFSERYDILLSSGHIRRGTGSIEESCAPASFPVDPLEAIHRVRVAFYDIRCAEGVTPPGNIEGLLPMQCEGTVTATPKDIYGNDVPLRVHGPEIEWELEQVDLAVALEPVDDAPFNKNLYPRDVGKFRLCATVQGIRGCMDGEVVP